jgi:hypothetical protein
MEAAFPPRCLLEFCCRRSVLHHRFRCCARFGFVAGNVCYSDCCCWSESDSILDRQSLGSRYVKSFQRRQRRLGVLTEFTQVWRERSSSPW